MRFCDILAYSLLWLLISKVLGDFILFLLSYTIRMEIFSPDFEIPLPIFINVFTHYTFEEGHECLHTSESVLHQMNPWSLLALSCSSFGILNHICFIEPRNE